MEGEARVKEVVGAHAERFLDGGEGARAVGGAVALHGGEVRGGDGRGGDVYGRGLKEYPGERHLENNAAVVWDSWARTHWPAKDWDAAIKVHEHGLQQLSKNSVLKQKREYCQEQKK
jgi:hypothetical protein